MVLKADFIVTFGLSVLDRLGASFKCCILQSVFVQRYAYNSLNPIYDKFKFNFNLEVVYDS